MSALGRTIEQEELEEERNIRMCLLESYAMFTGTVYLTLGVCDS